MLREVMAGKCGLATVIGYMNGAGQRHVSHYHHCTYVPFKVPAFDGQIINADFMGKPREIVI